LKLKVKALLKRENTWDIVETKTILDLVLTTIGGLKLYRTTIQAIEKQGIVNEG